MATGQWPSLMDLSSRLDPEGKIPIIADMLSQSNDWADDAPWVEANEATGHEFVFRSSIPAGVWRSYNMGVPYAKSTTGKARVGIGMLEDYSQVDRALAEHSGSVEKFRYTEDAAFLEGMSQTIAQTIFYGNTTQTPSEFMGLSSFYNTINTANALNAANVIDGGGTASNNTSIWMVGWSPRSFYCIYPRGSKAGLDMDNKGDVMPGLDALGNRFEAYTTWFRQQAGLVPNDWRFAQRIANIDTTNAGLAGSNPPDLFALFAQMFLMSPTSSRSGGNVTKTDDPNGELQVREVIYMNRTGRHWLDVQAMRQRNVLLSIDDYAGKPVDGIRGRPVKIVDQILNTESRVT